jgi:hypothetical protein
MLKIANFLDNQLIDGAEVVRIIRRQRFTPQKHFFVSSTRFCWWMSKFQDLVWLEGCFPLAPR